MKQINVYLSVWLLFVMCLIACATPVSSAMNCETWLSETIVKIEAIPMQKRYVKILEELARGCKEIPSALSEAAQKSLNEKNVNAKRRLMMASEPYVPGACLDEDPGMAANELLHICKKGDFPEGEFSAILKHIDAATYLFGKALKMEFEKTGIYEPHGQRLVSNFFLSDALLRESML